MSVLVTGGAGYIGSHMVRLLRRRGYSVSVVDDLSSGSRLSIPEEVPFLRADVGERESVTTFLREREVDTIFHFAARIEVGESVRDPRAFYGTNVAGTIGLLDSALDSGVRNFIFSSTAAVYGVPAVAAIDEGQPTNPVNPYGETKLTIEKMLASYGAAYGLRYAALRYFNAAGADEAGGIGEAHEPETHLLPLVIEAAMGRRASITVFGQDYGTPDGTCIRDYVHVCDLAEAHLAALDHLERGGRSDAFNLGTGTGHSVREVIESVERITRKRVPVESGARRSGDPDVLVAAVGRAREVLGWSARHAHLDSIVRDAVRWHQERVRGSGRHVAYQAHRLANSAVAEMETPR